MSENDVLICKAAFTTNRAVKIRLEVAVPRTVSDAQITSHDNKVEIYIVVASRIGASGAKLISDRDVFPERACAFGLIDSR